MKRKKTIAPKRISRFNMTALNFGTSSLLSTFNPRSSHQALNNIQLRDF